MTTSLQKSQLKRHNILKKIKVDGNVDKGRDVNVGYETATLKYRGFESQMVIWTKIYARV